MNEDIAVTTFRNYLRINTEHPNPNYEPCKKFLIQLAEGLNLEKNVYECVPGKPIVVLTHRGTNPSLQSLLLNSHTDVVTTCKKFWKFDPYEAVKDSDGKIYGRGTQDMKSNGIQYVEALRRLFNKGKKQFLRTIHLTFVPEEEIGGANGMGKFVETTEFKDLNVGFSLDEGCASETEEYKVFYNERDPWWSVVSCKGFPCHGSLYKDGTASEKFRNVINNFLSYADEERQHLRCNPNLTIGDVVTVNLTRVEGGTDVNILPVELKAHFDIRIPPTYDYEEMKKKFKGFCEAAGSNVEMRYIMDPRPQCLTNLSEDDPWWKAFSSVFKKKSEKIVRQIFPGSTDSRYLRQKGVRAIGFSPINNTPILLHDHNEYIEESVFLHGVEIYENLIIALADLPEI